VAQKSKPLPNDQNIVLNRIIIHSFIYSFSHGTTITSKQSNDNITK